jgi:hypothetical protein
MCAARHTNPTIVLVTVGHGGATLYHGRTRGLSNCHTHTYDWRRYLDEPSDHVVIAPDVPVVDCTVDGCDTVGYAINGPLFSADLKDDEFFELGDKRRTWRGERLSGIATCGRDVLIAHAASYGCRITYAGSGDTYPLEASTLTGEADERNSLIALGIATNPAETIAAVMLSDLTNHAEASPRSRLERAAGTGGSGRAGRVMERGLGSDSSTGRAR